MDSKNSRANLKKYIKVHSPWRFVPVMKRNGVPVPLGYYENGRRVQCPAGTSP